MFFGSDNQPCASQVVLDAISAANHDFTHGYGNDNYTANAIKQLQDLFEYPVSVFFVATGTAANCLSLGALVNPWQTILCHEHSHVFMDESTAPEWFTGGARMVSIASKQGKVTLKHLEHYFTQIGDDIPHNPQVGALTLTQTNELGQVYSLEEIQSIGTFCQRQNIHFHMDGARFANAIAHLNCAPADITWKAGVDILSLGATKCGGLCAEAIIVFKPELAQALTHLRKRSGHLISKGRLFGAQFSAWLQDQHWLSLAHHANHQAQQLKQALNKFSEIEIIWPVDANEIFITLPKPLSLHLKQHGAEFYDWYPSTLPSDASLNADNDYVRLVTSFLTSDEHINAFIQAIQSYYTA